MEARVFRIPGTGVDVVPQMAGTADGRWLECACRLRVRSVTSIDSNGLLRWLLDDVPGAAQKVERRLASNGPLAVADVAIVEVVFVLEKVMRIGRRTVADSVGAVLAEARFACDRGIWRAVVKTWVDHPKLSVVDVYLWEVARRAEQVPLLTFDRKLASQIDVAQLF